MIRMFDKTEHRLVGTAQFNDAYTWHCSCGSHARKQWPTPEVAKTKWEQGHIKELETHKRWMENGRRFGS